MKHTAYRASYAETWPPRAATPSPSILTCHSPHNPPSPRERGGAGRRRHPASGGECPRGESSQSPASQNPQRTRRTFDCCMAGPTSNVDGPRLSLSATSDTDQCTDATHDTTCSVSITLQSSCRPVPPQRHPIRAQMSACTSSTFPSRLTVLSADSF